MALAVSSLGDRRRDWALAMEVEFEAARADGKPLAFALGCLMAAWRELPAHEEGRLKIASHALAFLLILPIAALLASNVLAGFPGSYLGPIGSDGWMDLSGGQTPLLSDGNQSAIPALGTLILLLAGAHLRLAWLVLERDWERVAALGMLITAATMALTIFTSIVFAYCASALTQALILTVELASIWALARRHGRSFGGSSEALS
jgi:hypothetical protein